MSHPSMETGPPKLVWNKAVLLVNRGSRRGPDFLEDAERLLKEEGLPLFTSDLVDGGELKARIRRYVAEGADLVVVGGGDGTLRLAAEEMCNSSATLGVLPLGTGNNFARDLHLPLDLPGACRAIRTGHIHVVDLGEAELVNREKFIFVNAAHIGLFGVVNPNMSDQLKRRYGRLAYLRATWEVCREFVPFHLQVGTENSRKNWEVVQASLIMGRAFGGGMGEIPGETLDDHRMTLTIIEKDALSRLLLTVMQMRKTRHADPPKAHRYLLKEVNLIPDPDQPINLDGEIVGQTPVTMRVLPGALRVIGGDPASFSRRDYKPLMMAGGVALGLAAGAWFFRRRNSKQDDPPSPKEPESLG